MWTEIDTWWDGLAPHVQTALIGAGATGTAALFGALLVVWQIGRQARNAIAANSASEAMKLKKEVYSELMRACEAALDVRRELLSYVQEFQRNLSERQIAENIGATFDPPRARPRELSKKYFKASEKMSDLIGLQERWEIIDPRSSIFRLAFAYVYHHLTKAWGGYFDLALKHMPYDPLPDGRVFPWSVPKEKDLVLVRAATSELEQWLSLQECYILDFQVEMQNALLGDLFKGNKVPNREPIDPKYRVISLKNHEALKQYFEGTGWGKYQEKTKKEALGALEKLPT